MDSLTPPTQSSFAGLDVPRRDWSANASDLKILSSARLSAEAWLIHGFSTRVGGVSEIAGSVRSGGGDLNLGFTNRDTSDAVLLNREKFLSSLLPEKHLRENSWGLATLKQMHSSLVRRVGRAEIAERASLWGDGLVTDEPGVLLAIQTADCLPILIADPQRRAVGAFHAGWRGTLKGIVERGVVTMGREFGSAPREMIAAIGPGIGRCCFAVGEEVRDLFRARYAYANELFSDGQALSLDLAKANRRQLLAAGLSSEAIFDLDACTSCHTNEFFSYRAERGKTGRMMAVIGIAPD